MCWSTIPGPVCVGARFPDLYVLEHDSQTCMCWSTIHRPVCVGARFPDLYVLEHDSQTCMCWSTIPRPVCAGPIQTRSPICFSIFTSHLVFQNFCDGHKKSHGSRSITEYAKSSTACRNYLTSPILHKHVTPCFFKSSILVQKTEQLYALGHAALYVYALGHAAPTRMRWGTLLLRVCAGARCS